MSYTPILIPSDLTTHIYQETLAEITRDDESKVIMAIDMAIQEAKTYLTRYDIVQIFGDPMEDIAATFPPDSYLLNIIKTIAIWQLMSLGNGNMLYESWEKRYESVVRSLKDIQKGASNPKWPYLDTTAQTAPPSDQVTIQSNPLRNNYY